MSRRTRTVNVPENSDPYDIFDPPSLGGGEMRPSRTVVHGFGQDVAEDAPTVCAWNADELRKDAAWLLNGATPAPVPRDQAPDAVMVGDAQPEKAEPESTLSKSSTVAVPLPMAIGIGLALIVSVCVAGWLIASA